MNTAYLKKIANEKRQVPHIFIFLRFAKVYDVMTKFMVEEEATGIMNFISLWPELSSRMKPILKDVAEDNKMILEKLQQNKTPVSVVIFTSAFFWLGTFGIKP